MYAVFYFVGIYFTLVEGNPASQAGIQLLYYIPGISGQSSHELPPRPCMVTDREAYCFANTSWCLFSNVHV